MNKKTARQTAAVRTAIAKPTDDDLLSPVIPDVDGEGDTTPVTPVTGEANEQNSGGMFLSKEMLAELISSAVTSAVAAVNAGGGQAIADSISKAMQQFMGPQQRRIFDVVMNTPFNPTGRKRELKHEYYQCGYPIQERNVSDDEIEMLHQLVPGTYGPEDFPILVAEKKRLGAKNRIYIMHKDGKDDRLRMKTYAPTFHALLVKLVAESKDQKAARRAEARALLADTD